MIGLYPTHPSLSVGRLQTPDRILEGVTGFVSPQKDKIYRCTTSRQKHIQVLPFDTTITKFTYAKLPNHSGSCVGRAL